MEVVEETLYPVDDFVVLAVDFLVVVVLVEILVVVVVVW